MLTGLHIVLSFLIQWSLVFFEIDMLDREYHPPLNVPLILAANFGELRPNHFHMGLDFKTQGREGLNLHSIDDGYVSRVNVSPYGYGRVVYINHPGGITSVYAHCQQLTGALEEKVKSFQTRAKSSEADIYFRPNEIPLKKGEVFALSGNTGSSSGPHLHFEIRDTKTEEALNPLLFGFDIRDSRAPQVFNLKIYALDEYGYMIQNKTREFPIKNRTVGTGTIAIPSDFCSPKGGIGFAINGIDKYNAAENSCGLYGLTLRVNNDTLMYQKIDRIPFSQTRFLNAYTDYHAFRSGKKYHKSFHSVVNPLKIYKTENQGILRAKPAEIYAVSYSVFDHAGNETRTDFTLVIDPGPLNFAPSKIEDDNYIDPMKSSRSHPENAQLEIPIACTYEPIMNNSSWSENSVVLRSDAWPVQEAFTVRLPHSKNDPIEKQYLAVNRGNGSSSLTTENDGNWLIAKSKLFGEIVMKTDFTPPSIRPVNMKSNISLLSTNRLIWKMADYGSGLMNYGLLINGAWHVLDYESKGDYAFFELKGMQPGKYEITVYAIDFSFNKSESFHTIVLR